MSLNNDLMLERKYAELCEKLSAHRLPKWEDLPDIELYMDQVIAVMEKTLSIYCEATPDDNRIITPSIINNYVKLKIIPAPIKKRYSKEHLAYLIIICILKQTLSISSIMKIIECQLKEKSIKELYTTFCTMYKEVIVFANVNESVVDFENETEESPDIKEDMTTFILKSAILSTTGKFMSEGILSVLFAEESEKQSGKKEKE